eukprot:gene46016-58983_t
MTSLTDDTPVASANSPRTVRDIAGSARRGAVFAVLAALIIVFSVAEPAFHSVPNLMSVLQAVSVVAILGVGVTISIAVGGFDLSVAGVISLTNVVMAVYPFEGPLG